MKLQTSPVLSMALARKRAMAKTESTGAVQIPGGGFSVDDLCTGLGNRSNQRSLALGNSLIEMPGRVVLRRARLVVVRKAVPPTELSRPFLNRPATSGWATGQLLMGVQCDDTYIMRHRHSYICILYAAYIPSQSRRRYGKRERPTEIC
jgi:hypothetical protein